MTPTFEYTDGLATPDSDAFVSLFYNEDSESLVVVFRTHGTKYLYEGVPLPEWEDFKDASSKGGWYRRYVQGDYTSEQLADDTQFVRVDVAAQGEPEDNAPISVLAPKSFVDAFNRKYTVHAVLHQNEVNLTGVTFDVDAANDDAAVDAFSTYVSRLNASGVWTVRSVTRHF